MVETEELLAGVTPPVEYSLGILTDQILDRSSVHLFNEAKQRLLGLARLGLTSHASVDRLDLKGATVFSPEQPASRDRALLAVDDQTADPESTVSSLACRLAISKAKAYRTLTRLLDLSPRKFIKRIRLQRSLERLRAEGVTVAEVAYAVGFSSLSYFTRAFKARYRALPSAWQ